MITNYDAIEAFKKFLLTQNPEVVAHVCANFAVDLNRFLHINELDEDEAKDLIDRTTKTCSDLLHYVEHGFPKELQAVFEDNTVQGEA